MYIYINGKLHGEYKSYDEYGDSILENGPNKESLITQLKTDKGSP